MNRPQKSDCEEYYFTYINQVPEGDIFQIMEMQMPETISMLENLSDEKTEYRYQPNKWSVKEVLGHVIDAERVFAYRALCIARNDPAALPSMEQDDYVKFGQFGHRTIRDLCEEFHHVRLANIVMFKSFDEEVLMRRGIASGFEFTVRSFPFILAGHERHHQKVLRDRYL